MSSKSAVKLVVPDGCARRALPLGRGPHRLEERAQGRRLLPRRPAADRRRLPARRCSCSMALVLAALVVVADVRCAASSAGPTARRKFTPDVLEQPRGQRARRGARLPVRVARRLVRRRPARLPAHRARLELLAGRRVPGGLGDRLRRRAGAQRRGLVAQACRRHARAARTDAPPTWLAFVLAAFPAAIAIALARRPRPDRRGHRRPDRVRRRLRAQLGRALVPDPRLRRRRQGRDERRLLLHGERRRPPRRHRALRAALPVAGARGLPLGVRAFVLAAGLLSLLLPRRAGQTVPRWYRGRVSTACGDAP